MEIKKVILIIMDGWGLGQITTSDAIQQARTPFVKSLYAKYPNSTLVTYGEQVGLPDGQMGNSEVGHLNIGAGRIVYQELQRIQVAIRDGSFAQNEVLLAAISYARNNSKPLHLLGLLGDGGVHAHTGHLKAILDLCAREKLSRVFMHLFTDGRDTDPKSALGYMEDLQLYLSHSVGTVATVCGRYYAMDRDKRWERIKLAYDAIVKGTGERAPSALTAIEQSYANRMTDEFILPTVIVDANQEPVAIIKEGDGVICYNFRTDRCREMTEVLTQSDMPEYGMHKLSLHFTSMTRYDHSFQNVHVIFESDDLKNTLGEIISKNKLSQIRIAETEKYPHVSFFFSGGRELPFDGERRIMIPSPRVATYDLQPEMSAYEITDAILPEIQHKTADFICLNLANADMVGHTGVWKAAIQAVETVDQCVEKMVTTGLENGYAIVLIADHGNADFMINADGTPNTTHTKNLVPLFVIDNDWKGKLEPGKLGDLAPTILHLMGLRIPAEMTGKILMRAEKAISG